MSVEYASSEQSQNQIRQIPDLSTYKKDLQILNELTKANLSLSEVTQLFLKYARLIPIYTSVLPKNTFENSKVYRVRNGVNLTTENIESITPFTYAPTSKCTRNLRASPKNCSVFYCSNSIVTSIVEMRLSKHEEAYIGAWETEFENDIKLAPFMNPTAIASSVWTNYAKNIAKGTNAVVKDLSIDKEAQLLELFDFTSKAFLEESEHYTITSWIADIVFDKMGLDLIAYPSIRAKYQSTNLAFRNDLADNFSLETVYKVLTNDNHEGDILGLELLAVGEGFKDGIKWRDRTPEDHKKLQKLIHDETNG